MGINIYVRLSGKTPANIPAHPGHSGLSGFAVNPSIREAYHGGPYATRFLFREAFVTGEARITATTLRRRLPEALVLAEYRERFVYHETSPAAIQRVTVTYTSFVEFCERMERLTGEPTLIVASY